MIKVFKGNQGEEIQVTHKSLTPGSGNTPTRIVFKVGNSRYHKIMEVLIAPGDTLYNRRGGLVLSVSKDWPSNHLLAKVMDSMSITALDNYANMVSVESTERTIYAHPVIV